MQERIVVPALGEEVTEVVVAGWRVAPGQWVEEGHVLLDLESDKASFEVRALAPGRVVACIAPVGTVAREGDVLGVLESSAAEEAMRVDAGDAGRSAAASRVEAGRSAAASDPPLDPSAWEVRVFELPPGHDRVVLERGYEPFAMLDPRRIVARRKL